MGLGLFLEGYDGTISIQALALLLIRVILAMYFVSSSLAGYDARALSPVEIGLRLVVAALILFKPFAVYGPAVLAWFAIMAVHYVRMAAATMVKAAIAMAKQRANRHQPAPDHGKGPALLAGPVEKRRSRRCRPNVGYILFITDQQRADYLGCYDRELSTPISMRWPPSVQFERFYVAAPVCMPSRASLMTCRMPPAMGCGRWGSRWTWIR